MAQTGKRSDAHAGGAPRHGRHASSASSFESSNDSVFNTQDIAIRSRHASHSSGSTNGTTDNAPIQATRNSSVDLSGLQEYAYGAPVEPAVPASYEYGVSSAAAEQESVLPENLRSKNGAPRKVLRVVLRVILIAFLLCLCAAIGAFAGLVYLMDVNPLVLMGLM